jgi:hypothetical protein
MRCVKATFVADQGAAEPLLPLTECQRPWAAAADSQANAGDREGGGLPKIRCRFSA